MAKSSSSRDKTAAKRTASVQTLGCKVNQFESAAISRLLEEAGYTLVGKDRPADLTVINTCTVTHKADFEARNLIRRAHRANPDGKTVVTGCWAQLRPEESLGLPGVALVVGQLRKGEILQLLEEVEAPAIVVEPPGAGGKMPDLGFPEFERTRAFFRIQDGCDARCAYCTVPAARGPSRSLSAQRVLEGVAHYGGRGYREVVLNGIHLGAWGLDLDPPQNLTGLLTQLVRGDGPRLRLSSLEPNEATPALIALAAGAPRICPHFHLPLQSGSNRTLRRMGRPYGADLFRERVLEIVKSTPEACLGADVLVGFPGEGDDEFEETRTLIESLPLTYLHVFPYSPRPGTPAASRPEQIPDKAKKHRVGLLRRLGQAKRIAFNRRFIGQVRPTLVESARDRKTGLRRGLSDNYIQILIADPAPSPGELAAVLIERVDELGIVFGRPI